MSSEMLARILNSDRKSDALQIRLIWNSAPVLKNIKISCMYTIEDRYVRLVCSLLYATGLKFRILCRNQDRDVIFIYREEQLKQYLNQAGARDFLNQYGYADADTLESALSILSRHVSDYYNKICDFPHEAGLFLGYPLADVEGFIRHNGAGYFHSGYWKVYSDVENTKQLFRKYDEAKDTAIAEFFAGKQIREIAC